jgi:hypothetical protein
MRAPVLPLRTLSCPAGATRGRAGGHQCTAASAASACTAGRREHGRLPDGWLEGERRVRSAGARLRACRTHAARQGGQRAVSAPAYDAVRPCPRMIVDTVVTVGRGMR